MKKDKVTVIVPIYIGGSYVKRCLDSIYNQDYDNFDVICVSYALNDESREIISKYKRIKLIEQKEKGVSAARNLGIKNVTGKFFMFIDADDYIKKDYISNHVKNMKDNDILISGFENRREDGKLMQSYLYPNNVWSRFLMPFVWGKMYRTSFFKDNNIKLKEDINYCEDALLNLHCYKNDAKVSFFNYTGYTWTYSGDSATSLYNSFNNRFDIIDFLKEAYSLINDKYYDYYIYYIYKWSLWYLLFAGKNSSYKEYMKQYKRVDSFNKEHNIHLTINPFSKKLNPEKFFNRVTVFVFSIIQKLKLMGLFARIYCRGNANEKTKK